jgi:hypothetical protein
LGVSEWAGTGADAHGRRPRERPGQEPRPFLISLDKSPDQNGFFTSPFTCEPCGQTQACPVRVTTYPG